MADQENWKKVKGVWKRTKDLASKGLLGTDKFRYLKKKKKKDYVTDPDATFGGKRIQIKDGPELKPAKRKTWQEIAGGGKNAPQADLSKIKRMKSPEEYKAKGGRAGFQHGGRIGLREGTKPLETAMHKKRAEQTQNVKKLTTSDDAYSPEKRQIKIFKKNRKDSGGRGMVKMTTDWSNLKDETSKAKKYFTKKVGRPTSVQVLGPKDFPKPRKKMYGGGRTNLLEELGRVEAEPSNRNRRAEVSRVHRELNRGYSSGGAVLKGKKVGIQIK